MITPGTIKTTDRAYLIKGEEYNQVLVRENWYHNNNASDIAANNE